MSNRPWQIWIDTGGTFADGVAVDPEGRYRSGKVLSSGALRDRVEQLLAAGEYPTRMLADNLNEGLLEPLEIRIPEGLLNPPCVADLRRCPAVVGGNVETSQRLVDTLIEALRIAGCSQGTMNNLSFGDDRFGYYETVAGGSGAGEGFDGTDGCEVELGDRLVLKTPGGGGYGEEAL